MVPTSVQSQEETDVWTSSTQSLFEPDTSEARCHCGHLLGRDLFNNVLKARSEGSMAVKIESYFSTLLRRVF